MVFKNKKRCHCHKPRHKRPSKALVVCDIILGLMIAIFCFFLCYLVIFPLLGIDVDLSIIINALYAGLWFVVLLIIVNIGWAIYYGCHKSAAGVLLSTMTASIMIYTYVMN